MSIRPAKTSAAVLLQAAIYTALATVLTGYDEAPENATFPYFSLGESVVIDRGNKVSHADEFIETIHIWSRAKGFKETKTNMAAVITKLSGTPLTVTGYVCKYMDVEQQSTFRDPDGLTRHGIVQIRFNLTQK